MVGHAGQVVVAAGVEGVGVAAKVVDLRHPLREQQGLLKGTGALNGVEGHRVGEAGLEIGLPQIDAVHAGIQRAHPLALAAQEKVLIGDFLVAVRVGVEGIDFIAQNLRQTLRHRLIAHKAPLRGPVVVGAEVKGRGAGRLSRLLQHGPQVQCVHPQLCQSGEKQVGVFMAVVGDALWQFVAALAQLLGSLDIEQRDVLLGELLLEVGHCLGVRPGVGGAAVQVLKGQVPVVQLDDGVVRLHVLHHPAAHKPLDAAVELDKVVFLVQVLVQGILRAGEEGGQVGEVPPQLAELGPQVAAAAEEGGHSYHQSGGDAK